MAGTIVASTLSDGTNSTSTTNCIQGSAKAWVNFNGTGTPAIRASYNVSSITDNGTGDYTVNFTNALPDANYAVVGTTSPSTGISNIPAATLVMSYATAPTTTARRIFTGDSRNGGFQDCEYVSVAIFR